MGDGAAQTVQVDFEKDPSSYKHWRVEYDGGIARVIMDVDPDGGLVPGYELKLNSYDLGVDIELADIVRRMRFEHPEVRTVLLSSGNDRAFCAGANITMLGQSSHAWKVNFCKFTNETRCELEDATNNSDQVYVAACNGTTAGGGYELALACKEIYLQDDGNSAVSLPEVPLLGVLPGTGGLTRLVDKRKIRRDIADVFSTTAEGVRGKKAVKWNLVDGVYPRSKFDDQMRARADQLVAEGNTRVGDAPRVGVALGRLQVEITNTETTSTREYTCVKLECDAATRIATLRVRGPNEDDLALVRQGPAAIHQAGDSVWALRAYRELDDALLQLRVNHLGIGLVLVEVECDAARTIAYDAALLDAGGFHDHKHAGAPTWFAREILLFMGRTLRRMDLTSRSFFAIGGAGTSWAGNLLELALASDRFYLLDDPDNVVQIGVGEINGGPLPMSHGHTRLAVRFYGQPDQLEALHGLVGQGADAILDPEQADEAGLVTVLLDDIDWEDDTRVAIEERASLSPDALTGMEANLRFPGPENCDSKIFARLTAWQNWIFIRPNATGPEGALTLYGRPERPRFDWERV